MKYFEFYIGDYERKTAHLSLAEHGAYLLMLQTFYASERPLPLERKVLYRLLRASGAVERKAIDSVITQFWHQTAEGLTNSRADEVVDEYQTYREKQKSNGELGGRPPKPKPNPKITGGLSKRKPNGNPNHNPTETQVVTQTEPKNNPLTPTLTPILTPNTLKKSPTHSGSDPDQERAREAHASENTGKKGSVCGNFIKIGGEETRIAGTPREYASAEEVMADLRKNFRNEHK